MDSAEHESKIELMMIQLLFKDRPRSLTEGELRKALKKYVGDLGEVKDSKISIDSPQCTFMFSLSGHKVVFKDAQEGGPVMAAYFVSNTASEIESGDTIDDMDENGDMQMSIQWKTRYEKSIVGPDRTVLDIDCGIYAGGNRG